MYVSPTLSIYKNECLDVLPNPFEVVGNQHDWRKSIFLEGKCDVNWFRNVSFVMPVPHSFLNFVKVELQMFGNRWKLLGARYELYGRYSSIEKSRD